MSSWDVGRLIYLVLLGAALVLWFVVQNRQSRSRLLQQAMAWALIFLGVVAAIGLWDDIRQTARNGINAVATENRIEVPRARDGHYYLTLLVNGVPVTFMIDTGASQIVLTERDARRIGIDTAELAYVGRATTANGEVRTAPVRLETVEIGPVRERNLRAWVNEGDLEQSLLGMSWLRRWDRIEITGQAMVLSR